MEKEFIEIPFGAKDSELCRWEYTIPDGFVASVENGKIIVKKEESEGEKDEKIRMALIHYFSHPENTSFEYWEAIPKSKAIAWLEKQGEQKSVDNIEPKFKVGDWIVDKSGLAQQVLDFRGGIYTCTYNSFTTDCESNYHLWTIKDAKDGDVLKEDSCIFIIERMKPDGTAIIHCCLFDDGDFDLGTTLSFESMTH